MKFGKHLEKVNSRHPEWQGASLNYSTLKRMLKELHLVTMPQNGLPMQRAGITSLTVPPAPDGFGSSLVARYDGFEVTETDFFKSLDKEVSHICLRFICAHCIRRVCTDFILHAFRNSVHMIQHASSYKPFPFPGLID